MGRSFRSVLAVFLSLGSLFGLAGCGSGNSSAVVTTSYPTPSVILLTPTPSASLELGKTLQFSATPQNSSQNTLTTPVQFVSSNTAVVTVSSGGVACAGSWDSLTNPQVCTPGPVGTAQITAVAQGVSSAVTTIYVHQHIDNVQIAPIPDQTKPAYMDPVTNQACFSVGQTYKLQATASSRGTDVTSTAGIFTWQISLVNVADLLASTLSGPVSGLQPGQAQFTAKTPGTTTVYASVGNVISTPYTIETCPVQSIAITVNGSSNSTVTVAQGTTLDFQTTVTDIAGNTITGVPLTWSSSNPQVVGVTGSGDTASGTESTAGGSTVVASCTPSTCNVGFQPSRPIYPQQAVAITAQATSSPQGSSLVVSSDGCVGRDGCVTSIVGVAPSTTSGLTSYTVGTPTNITTAPNSLIFDRQGTNGYLGTPMSQSGTVGLLMLAAGSSGAGTISQYVSAPGKVLAVSPNGIKVVVSDTTDTPNAVYIFDSTTHTSTPLQISGATAADFSPDSLKAYIVAGSKLYIYSTQDALQSINLATPAAAVSFLPEGAFAYVAGGGASPGISTWITCQAYNSSSTPAQTTTLPSTPAFLKVLPNSSQILFLNSSASTISLLNVSTTPVGCPPSITNGSTSSYNLGVGTFVPTQFLVSSDGTRAYILTSNLASVLVFNVANHTTSSIAMAGSALPIRAALDPTGTLLYVIGSDGTIHVLNANTGLDTQQITMPANFCLDTTGNPASFTCQADLIAVK